MKEAEIYKALGDPIRLNIVMRLAGGAPSTIGKLLKNLGVTRQGARKQLQVLVSANVVHLIPKGRETQVVLDTETLEIARKFITNMESQWDQRLEALKNFVESEAANSRTDSPSSHSQRHLARSGRDPGRGE